MIYFYSRTGLYNLTDGGKEMVPNQWLRKCLASGIIFLFVGIAVQPITAISITQLNELEYIHKIK